MGVEEPEPGYQAELSVHIFQYLNTRGLLTVNVNKAARQDPAVVISEVRGLQISLGQGSFSLPYTLFSKGVGNQNVLLVRL